MKVIIYFILVFSGLAIVIMVSDLLLEKPRHQSEGLSISADFPQLEATSEVSTEYLRRLDINLIVIFCDSLRTCFP